MVKRGGGMDKVKQYPSSTGDSLAGHQSRTAQDLEGGVQAQRGGGLMYPHVTAEWPVSLDAVAYRLDLGLEHRRVNDLDPVGRSGGRSGIEPWSRLPGC